MNRITLIALLFCASLQAAEPLLPKGWRFVSESSFKRSIAKSTGEIYLQWDTKVGNRFIGAVSYNQTNTALTNISSPVMTNVVDGVKCFYEQKDGWVTRLIESEAL